MSPGWVKPAVVHHDDPDDHRAQEALRALRGKKRFRVDDTIAAPASKCPRGLQQLYAEVGRGAKYENSGLATPSDRASLPADTRFRRALLQN